MKNKTILFYSDMSSKSDLAFPLALELALAQRAQRLYILHVLSSPYRFRAEIVEPGMAMDLNPELLNIAERALRDRYEPALRGYQGASFHVLTGVAGIEVLRFVRKHEVDRVLLAQAVGKKALSQGTENLGDFLGERCPCPVLFLTPGRNNNNLAQGQCSQSPSSPRKYSKVLSLERYRIRREQRKYHDVRG